MKLTNSQLQRELDKLAKAVGKAYLARQAIYEHCEEVYGCTPSDIDNDEFLDMCDAGCGIPPGMRVAEFDTSMREAMKRM